MQRRSCDLPRFPIYPGVRAIRNLHALVGHIGRQRRQHCLERERSGKRGMVDVVSDDGQQIP
jgi:hypothetical protein